MGPVRVIALGGLLCGASASAAALGLSTCTLLTWNPPDGPQGVMCCKNSSDPASCVVLPPASPCAAHPMAAPTNRALERELTEVVVSDLPPDKPPAWLRPLVEEYGAHFTEYVKNKSLGDCGDHGGCKYADSLPGLHDVVHIPDIGRNMCTFYHHVAAHFNELLPYTLFLKTNTLLPQTPKDLLRAAGTGVFMGIDHPWLKRRRRFITVICDPRWEHLPIYRHLCPCSAFPPAATWNIGPHDLQGTTRAPTTDPHPAGDKLLLICMNDDHLRVKFLREGLPGYDGGPVRLPLIYEHYEEDIYLAHRDILRSYPRSFWKMREHACEDIGEKSHCDDSQGCTHAAAAQQWAYLIGKGSLAEFPANLVSPGVRMHNNYSPGGEEVPPSQMSAHIQEMAARAVQSCVGSPWNTTSTSGVTPLNAPSTASLSQARGLPLAQKKHGGTSASPPLCSPVTQVRDGETPVTFAVAPSGIEGFSFTSPNQSSHNPMSTYAIFSPTQLRSGLRGQWVHFSGDSSLRGLMLSLLQQIFDVGRYSEDAGPVRQMNFSKLTAKPLGTFGLGFIDAIISVDDGEVLHYKNHLHDAKNVAPGVLSTWQGRVSQTDTSAMLNEVWANLSQNAVRLTYRQCTRAVYLENETFMDVIGLEDGPDVAVIESGAWDEAAQTDVHKYNSSLLRVLGHFQAAAATRVTKQPYLIYSTMVSPHYASNGSSDIATFERRVLNEVNNNAKVRFNLLERMQTSAMKKNSELGKQCPGLGRGSTFTVHRFHPVHLTNLWDVQRLANMLLETQGTIYASCAVQDAPQLVEVGYGSFRGCCAEKVIFDDLGFKPNDGVAYWANICVVAESNPQGPPPKFSPATTTPQNKRRQLEEESQLPWLRGHVTGGAYDRRGGKGPVRRGTPR